MELNRTDCLDRLNGMPQRRFVSMAHLPATVAAKGVKAGNHCLGFAVPEVEAVNFYTLNHLVAFLQKKYTPNETLCAEDQAVLDAYVKELTAQSRRMFTYLALITTREARHCHGLPEDWKKEQDQKMVAFYEGTINGPSESTAMNGFMNSAPDVTIGVYVEFIEKAFRKGGWSSGFGGEAWAEVTEPLTKFIKGEASAEIMVDTGYTLAHNNGPIFNKGMQYGHYDQQSILCILDVQRSGQMPELVMGWASKFVKPETKALVSNFKQRYPDSFGEYVDWIKVKDLGGIGNYHSEIAKQKKLHGDHTKFNGQPVKVAGEYEVDPNLTLLIYERKLAA